MFTTMLLLNFKTLMMSDLQTKINPINVYSRQYKRLDEQGPLWNSFKNKNIISSFWAKYK